MRGVLLILILLFLPSGSVHAEASLQEMIDHASPHEVITLPDGVYQGPIHIDKPITLTGGSKTVVQGNGKGSVVTITAKGVLLGNLTITNSGLTGKDSGIRVEGDQTTIDRVTLAKVHNGVYLTSKGNRITNNMMSGEADLPVSKRGNGIQLDHSGKNIITGNRMASVQDGIYFDNAYDNLITQNVITGSRYGFHLMYAGRNQFQANEVNNSVTGAMVMETKDSVFKENRFVKERDTRGYGMLLFHCQSCHVHHNLFSDNTHGIGIDSVSGSSIEANTISSNSVGMNIFGPLQSSKISRNSLIGNVQQVVMEQNVSPEAFSDQGVGNYWDDYDGLDLTGDQIGEVGYAGKELLFAWVNKTPALQILFAGPAHSLMETLAASRQIVDPHPLIRPEKEGKQLADAGSERTTASFNLLCLSLLIGSTLIYRQSMMQGNVSAAGRRKDDN